ncbi:4-(cytidine 5'-diphospho)-2-C-methyl-D-erythritol kinase [Microvirga pudoricolor]|uniref:4-(cytidine 5'-diphospho)-2-C-methyl-D-erythritol kinase n=1 Tax=Microvirga pudoricolor TaxID=2778729 RepID=UPI001E2D0F90|nr:4-(cytidine 5'-diphospho)-2-C-methyl-D-erythritol kinase [Microvirga pudoricolor]MBM6595920.1 4-(cytidine 5'-diphospho)-2-C-methyl-D-erythritol kinase [Microvirga pudoricolor]
MPKPLSTHAPAKVNLTLHVLGRRPDGYHELESLVAFAGTGDTLRLEPGSSLALTVDGPTAAAAGAGPDNLVLRAARLLAARVDGLRVGAFHLTKRLPVAAGIGGGSSDAAAALRLLAELNGLPVTDPSVLEAARLTGADVPVCLDPRARMMRGAGERVGPTLNLPPLHAILVNPRVSVETPAVFKALGLAPGQNLTGAAHPVVDGEGLGDFLAELASARNDLEPAARALHPLIGTTLALMRGTSGCRVARMSGSGATVFGLYEGAADAQRAAEALRDARPEWWVEATELR